MADLTQYLTQKYIKLITEITAGTSVCSHRRLRQP